MKTKLIFLPIILLTFHTYAQETETYKSFLHSGVVKWLYFEPVDACGLDEFSAFGDTIINHYEYKKLWYSGNFISLQSNSDVNQQWLFRNDLSTLLEMFLRQSSDSSKLYLYDAMNNKEYLFVDMSLKVGDEFNFPGIGNQIVDSVSYNNGLKTIHFRKNHILLAGELMFVESIGPNVNFLHVNREYFFYPLLNSIMICYSRYSFLYVEPPYSCKCWNSGTQEITKSQLHYKLVNDNIEIQLNEFSSVSWELLDFSGKVVRRSELTNESVLRISTTGLSRGLYLIRLYESGKESSVTLKVLL